MAAKAGSPALVSITLPIAKTVLLTSGFVQLDLYW